MAFSIIMRAFGTLISLYMILIMARIILTWFPTALHGRSLNVLSSITDPYLDIFRRIPILRSETLDFSPIAALALLSVAAQIFATAAAFGHVTVGLVLALVLHPVWRVVDALINPVLYRINRVIYRNRIVNFRQGLLTGIILMFGLRLAGGALFGLAAGLLARLPF